MQLSNTNKMILVECPRDAMQGWKNFIPTNQKIDYLNALLKVGFDVLDCGSFVSAKAIPQMADTAEVINALDLSNSSTKLLVIVANQRGAEEAVAFEKISYLGFPFSISPSFQLRNTNSTLEESFERVKAIQSLCVAHQKELVIYLSMGFGNPYGDLYNQAILLKWAGEMAALGIKTISLADTVGLASPDQITDALTILIPQYPQVQFGVHLHASAANWEPKLTAAINAGCNRIDGALKGIGGCPMAQDDLVGNMDTENIIQYLKHQQLLNQINTIQLQECSNMVSTVFQ
ncbi:MAG TPA: hydroxymethylglutaryl-CoA lyase [Sediminibacterium sp.]|jgi:hydroxymethylglutaryl-CoA lyase|uniref:hydroxymethylglutaryl-CoA lyase n=1 Tax=Sediminibacterium sp. TaxID=1917865 RepID=UPI0026A9662D|nr:hydroxymethylglutaryl-CoA lyase [Sediminibacterium sp.]HQS24312.1 hydroxymethylglutaryl-CoA lyase [Sediminibacterium sp.]HQS34596.1 hydroxymethylglutaryl-CoA lyase [Sediminibacterium sp.]